MVKIAEVVLELTAEGFMNTGRKTKGRIVRDIHDGKFSVQVDDEVTKVDLPTTQFGTEQEARIALLDYWDRCDKRLVSEGAPCWKPKQT